MIVLCENVYNKRLLTNQTNQTKATESSHMTTTFSATLFLPTSCPHHNFPSNFLLPSTTETLRKNPKKKFNEKVQNTKLKWKDVIDYVLPLELGILILQDPA